MQNQGMSKELDKENASTAGTAKAPQWLVDEANRRLTEAERISKLCKASAEQLTEPNDAPLRELLNDAARSIIDLLSMIYMFSQAVKTSANINAQLLDQLEAFKERSETIKHHLS